jgi:hypothetical protein
MKFTAVSPFNVASKVSLPEKIVVYDSTLRDGEQMPGVHFTPEQKQAIAMKLAEIGVHQIEAGFPAVSDEEKKSVKAIAELGLDSDILCLARTMQSDIDIAADCDVDMVLLFIATSDLHMRYKLKMSREDVLGRVVTSLEYAHTRGLKVSLSTEDSTRSTENARRPRPPGWGSQTPLAARARKRFRTLSGKSRRERARLSQCIFIMISGSPL